MSNSHHNDNDLDENENEQNVNDSPQNKKMAKFNEIVKQTKAMHPDFNNEDDDDDDSKSSHQNENEDRPTHKNVGVHYGHNVDKLHFKEEDQDKPIDEFHSYKDEGDDDNDENNTEIKTRLNINKGETGQGNFSHLNATNVNANANVNVNLPQFDLSQFQNLKVSPEIKELLSVMNNFSTKENVIDTKFKPFIPCYIPSIGEVDAFLKINRPDNITEELGLNALDEPTSNGIDPSILSLELSSSMKSKIPLNLIIRKVENAEQNPTKIQNWVEQISNLHKEKLSSSVSYSSKMPDIETLMQVWPEGVENILNQVSFPNECINMSVENYSKIICNMLDIPVGRTNNQKSLIESLHVLFSLYSEFKSNQHFQRGYSKKIVHSEKYD